LGCPIANLHSARSDLWEPQFVLRPTQLRKKHCFVKSTSNDLTAVGITTYLPSELTSSLRIGEFPCRLLRTKNHHFAALRFPDFQRWVFASNNGRALCQAAALGMGIVRSPALFS
jgi:DNA-binding transcriptional LysR family regulator